MENPNPTSTDLTEQFRLLAKEVDEYAIFLLDTGGHVTSWNRGAERLKGYSKAKILGEHFSIFYPDEAVQAGKPEEALRVAAREGDWTDEDWRVRNDGSRFWARVTLTALRDESGALRGFAKVTRDLTERRRREEELKRQKQRAERENVLLRLLQRVTAMANSTSSLEQTLQEAINTICEHIGWPVGHVYWLCPEEEVPLVPSGIWCLPAEERFEAFRSVSEEADFKLGESLPGAVAARSEPIWIEDVTEEPNFVRAKKYAEKLGVKGAFAVPVQVGTETVAVLEFFSSIPKERDDRLLEAVASVGVQLSRVAEREQAQQSLQESEEKFRALAEQSLVGIELIQDGVYKYVNPTFAGYFGYEKEELIGQSPETVFHPEDWPRVQKEIQRRITGEKQEARFTAQGQSRDGETVHLEVYGQRIRYRGRPAIVGAALDVTKQKRLQREILRIQEEERKRLGQDLHDVISSQLTGANLLLNAMATRVKDKEMEDQIEKVGETIKESAEDVRHLSHGLNPIGLLDGNLLSAVRGLLDNTEGTSFEVTVESEEDPEEAFMLDAEVATHLYRIAQEAVTNARKYAEAPRISVRLRREEDALVLKVEDDGKGFDPSDAENKKSLGLRSMQHRAELLDAQLTIDSAPGEGTLVRCRLPT